MKTYFGILVYAGKGPKDLMEKRAETVGGDFTPPFLKHRLEELSQTE